MKQITVGIVGSRRRDTLDDLMLVDAAFRKVTENFKVTQIISGGAKKGGDRFAEIIAAKYDVPIKIFYPDWSKYGRIAGFTRNTDIAKESDILIACVHPDRKGGTEDTIKKYLKFHKSAEVILS